MSIKSYISKPSFKICVDAWKCLSESEKEKWNKKTMLGEHSGYNAFIKDCMKNGLCVNAKIGNGTIIIKKKRKQSFIDTLVHGFLGWILCIVLICIILIITYGR